MNSEHAPPMHDGCVSQSWSSKSSTSPGSHLRVPPAAAPEEETRDKTTTDTIRNHQVMMRKCYNTRGGDALNRKNIGELAQVEEGDKVNKKNL